MLIGYRTYIMAGLGVVTGAVAAAQVLGYEIPVYVLTILAALGLYSVRSAIKTPQ